MADIRLRRARPGDAPLLSELAVRSKGHWGYDQVFLDSCRAELTIRPDEVSGRRIVLAEAAGQILGFIAWTGTRPLASWATCGSSPNGSVLAWAAACGSTP